MRLIFQTEGFSVNLATAVFPYGFIMLFRRITLVLGEIIFRILSMLFLHYPVPCHFGDNAGGGAGKNFSICFYY